MYHKINRNEGFDRYIHHYKYALLNSVDKRGGIELINSFYVKTFIKK